MKINEKFGKINQIYKYIFIDNYIRLQISAEKGRWTMIVAFDESGAVDAIAYLDPDPILPVPRRNSTPMRLPFDGTWTVTSGGPLTEQNHHLKNHHISSAHAIDFAILGDNDAEHRGDPSKNENYHAFGKDILSVADGTVVMVIDGVPDNRPQTFNPLSTTGNTIIIKHKENEYSLYGHLKHNSTIVKTNQKVLSGQKIAECGNSGYSNGPHLHSSLSNIDNQFDATSFPPAFRNTDAISINRILINQEYSPVKGDFVTFAGR